MSSSALVLDPSSVLSPSIVGQRVSSYLGSVPSAVLVNELIDVVSRCVESSIPINPAPLSQNLLLPSLLTFVEQVVYAAKSLPVTLLCTIAYVDRIRVKLPMKARGNHETHHRIFLAALILSTKYLYDVPLKNKHWATFSRVFSCPEVNLMELQFLKLLDYDLEVKMEDVYATMQRYNLNAVRRPSICRPTGASCNFQFQYPTHNPHLMQQGVPATFGAASFCSVPYAMNNGCLPMSNAIATARDAQMIASMMTMMPADATYMTASGKVATKSRRTSSSSMSSLKSRSSRSNNTPVILGGKLGAKALAGPMTNGGIVKKTSVSGSFAIPASLPARIELSPGELEVFNEMVATPTTYAPAPSTVARPLSVPSYQLA
jgi:hypothetical protein